jgi:hypothetical protein
MSKQTVTTRLVRTPTHGYQRSIVGIETAMAVFGLGGGVMLMSGHWTPPVEALNPLGLSSWVLPGMWLTASVAVPSATAAYLAWRRSPAAPKAVLAASALLGIELLVQIPFLGVNGLQAAMTLIGGTAATLAWRARATW